MSSRQDNGTGCVVAQTRHLRLASAGNHPTAESGLLDYSSLSRLSDSGSIVGSREDGTGGPENFPFLILPSRYLTNSLALPTDGVAIVLNTFSNFVYLM